MPVAARRRPDWGVGHDALALAGLLALARFAVAAAAWDIANGFALMGASRDLTLAVFVEATLRARRSRSPRSSPARPTCAASSPATAGSERLVEPGARARRASRSRSSSIAETGRQPVDNPDTHLELTMIHEGPLLEYAGRDLAYLQWAAAARHWVVLVLAAQVFLPHAERRRGGSSRCCRSRSRCSAPRSR